MVKKRKIKQSRKDQIPVSPAGSASISLDLERVDQNLLRINPAGGMRVPGLVYLSQELMDQEGAANALQQVANVACLPGIVKASLAMPDMHWGYGFPIGGVAAFDAAEGVVSPGGVGYDINCGCRLMTTDLMAHEMGGKMAGLLDALFAAVPCGVGRQGEVRVSNQELKKVLCQGASWAVAQGLGEPEDLDNIEDRGCLEGADPGVLSERALERGRPQLGTLGSGNHFLELDVVEEIFDPEAARVYGLGEGQLAVQLHSGSRGLGYQVCDDNLKLLLRWASRQGIALPDRQLVYAPLNSPQARAYLAGMKAAANFAFANRQIMTHLTRRTFEESLRISPKSLNMRLVIDVCHNIAKMEKHIVEGEPRLLCVHRKGATRAFAAGRPELPEAHRSLGQPVLIPGDMGRASYLLKALPGAMEQTFGSTCHGAGRSLSRQAAKKAARGRLIDQELDRRGVIVRAAGRATLAEEMPEAYKDVSRVVEVVHRAGISAKVARLRPLGVVKG